MVQQVGQYDGMGGSSGPLRIWGRTSDRTRHVEGKDYR